MTHYPSPPFRVSKAALEDIKAAFARDKSGAITLHTGELSIDGESMGLCVSIVRYGKEHPAGYDIFDLAGIPVSVSPSSLRTLRGSEIIVEKRPVGHGDQREVMCVRVAPEGG